MLDVFVFLTGMGAGLMTQEAGHQLAASILQDRISWSGTTWECQADCDGATIAASGLLMQSLSSEVLLNSPGIPKRQPFVAGWLVWNIANPIVYTLRHEFFGPHGDFTNYSRRDARIMEALLIAHAASTTLRWTDTESNIETFFFPQDDGIAFGVAMRW